MSLHGYRVNLHGLMVSLNSSRVSLCSSGDKAQCLKAELPWPQDESIQLFDKFISGLASEAAGWASASPRPMSLRVSQPYESPWHQFEPPWLQDKPSQLQVSLHGSKASRHSSKWASMAPRQAFTAPSEPPTLHSSKWASMAPRQSFTAPSEPPWLHSFKVSLCTSMLSHGELSSNLWLKFQLNWGLFRVCLYMVKYLP